MKNNSDSELTTYKIEIDGGEGGDASILVSTLTEAIKYAEKWLRGGTWKTRGYVTVAVYDTEGNELYYSRVWVEAEED